MFANWAEMAHAHRSVSSTLIVALHEEKQHHTAIALKATVVGATETPFGSGPTATQLHSRLTASVDKGDEEQARIVLQAGPQAAAERAGIALGKTAAPSPSHATVDPDQSHRDDRPTSRAARANPAQWRPTVSKKLKEVISRALQPKSVLKLVTGSMKLEAGAGGGRKGSFIICNTLTGVSFKVVIDEHHSCSCTPSEEMQVPCDHILFVLLNLLAVPPVCNCQGKLHKRGASTDAGAAVCKTALLPQLSLSPLQTLALLPEGLPSIAEDRQCSSDVVTSSRQARTTGPAAATHGRIHRHTFHGPIDRTWHIAAYKKPRGQVAKCHNKNCPRAQNGDLKHGQLYVYTRVAWYSPRTGFERSVEVKFCAERR